MVLGEEVREHDKNLITPLERTQKHQEDKEDTEPQESPKHVELKRTPEGWSNDLGDLNRWGYFHPGEPICELLEEKRYTDILPVMVSKYDTYIIQGSDENGAKSFFLWNSISGTVMVTKEKNIDLRQVVETVGLSELALDVEYLDTT